MPTIKRKVIYGSLKQALDYITNPKKTQNEYLVSGHLCSPAIADIQMQKTKEKFHKFSSVPSSRTAYHIIQSFSYDDPVTPQQVHEIGKKLVEELYPDHEAVIATHDDKLHLHNHILINSISSSNGKKINDRLADEEGSLFLLMQKSNEIAKRYGCNVQEKIIIPKYKKNKYTYVRSSEKEEFFSLLDSLLIFCKSFSELSKELSKRGYSLKETNKRTIVEKEKKDIRLPDEIERELEDDNIEEDENKPFRIYLELYSQGEYSMDNLQKYFQMGKPIRYNKPLLGFVDEKMFEEKMEKMKEKDKRLFTDYLYPTSESLSVNEKNNEKNLEENEETMLEVINRYRYTTIVDDETYDDVAYLDDPFYLSSLENLSFENIDENINEKEENINEIDLRKNQERNREKNENSNSVYSENYQEDFLTNFEDTFPVEAYNQKKENDENNKTIDNELNSGEYREEISESYYVDNDEDYMNSFETLEPPSEYYQDDYMADEGIETITGFINEIDVASENTMNNIEPSFEDINDNVYEPYQRSNEPDVDNDYLASLTLLEEPKDLIKEGSVVDSFGVFNEYENSVEDAEEDKEVEDAKVEIEKNEIIDKVEEVKFGDYAEYSIKKRSLSIRIDRGNIAELKKTYAKIKMSKDNEYFYIQKEGLTRKKFKNNWVYNYLFEMNKNYDIYDDNNKVIKTVKGEDMASIFTFGEVGHGLRKRVLNENEIDLEKKKEQDEERRGNYISFKKRQEKIYATELEMYNEKSTSISSYNYYMITTGKINDISYSNGNVIINSQYKTVGFNELDINTQINIVNNIEMAFSNNSLYNSFRFTTYTQKALVQQRYDLYEFERVEQVMMDHNIENYDDITDTRIELMKEINKDAPTDLEKFLGKNHQKIAQVILDYDKLKPIYLEYLNTTDPIRQSAIARDYKNEMSRFLYAEKYIGKIYKNYYKTVIKETGKPLPRKLEKGYDIKFLSHEDLCNLYKEMRLAQTKLNKTNSIYKNLANQLDALNQYTKSNDLDIRNITDPEYCFIYFSRDRVSDKNSDGTYTITLPYLKDSTINIDGKDLLNFSGKACKLYLRKNTVYQFTSKNIKRELTGKQVYEEIKNRQRELGLKNSKNQTFDGNKSFHPPFSRSSSKSFSNGKNRANSSDLINQTKQFNQNNLENNQEVDIDDD